MGDEFRIGLSDRTQKYPQVVYNGEKYFVIWREKEENTRYYLINGVHVTTMGTLVDTPITLIKYFGTGGCHPAVAYGKDVYLVIWSGYLPDTGLYCAIFDTSLKDLNAERIKIDTTFGDASCVFDGENFVVCWICKTESGDELRVVKVSPEGKVLGEPKVLKRHWYVICWPPEVAFDGNNILVLFALDEYYDEDIYCLKLNRDLQILKEFNVATDPNILEGTSGGQAIACGDNISYIAYCARECVWGTYLGSLGQNSLLGKVEGYIGGPQIAYDGRNFLVVMGYFLDSDNYPMGVKGVLIGNSGEIKYRMDIVPVSYLDISGEEICASSGQFLVVYAKEIDTTNWQSDRIFGRIVWDVEACREHFVAYPNPCRDFINLQLIAVGDEEVEVKLYDVMGRLRMKKIFQLVGTGRQNFRINFSGLSEGIYFLIVKRGEKLFKKKICKIGG